ncbi:MAG: TatD family hydrolase [Clostridia bacterium]|nr:TatD family hydrolase [Clostridia bacterium]
MKYIDVHTHLTDSRLDVENLYKELNGNTIVVNSGYDLDSTSYSVTLAEKYQDSYFTCGLHPNELKGDYNSFLSGFYDICKHKKCLAVGECGLDYHYSPEQKQEQKKIFIEQIKIADELNMPLVIHSRECVQDMLNIIEEYKGYLNNGILLHCFSDSAEVAKILLKYNAYFSFGGVITFKNAKKERVLKEIPIDRVLSETDSPYMAPVPYRGTLNTSKNIPIIVDKLAKIYGVEHNELKEQILINAQNFYKVKF